MVMQECGGAYLHFDKVLPNPSPVGLHWLTLSAMIINFYFPTPSPTLGQIFDFCQPKAAKQHLNNWHFLLQGSNIFIYACWPSWFSRLWFSFFLMVCGLTFCFIYELLCTEVLNSMLVLLNLSFTNCAFCILSKKLLPNSRS